ncbi:MAG: DUF4445 domain-containing protein [Verrucomicrobia bacterium]|nr:DUF4445 domain-containing protein [Verrucomicrobiota bacterium]MBU1910407.1 DUF4445 domain-containing protein [Verrucomicrobiota bacterium]
MVKSIKIRILPSGKETTAEAGETLNDVLQRAGVPLEAACGGEGTCGRCAVQVVKGHCDWPGSDLLPSKMLKEGYVLSCQATAADDLVVKIPDLTEVTIGELTPYTMPEAETAALGPLSPLAIEGVLTDRSFGIACDIGTTTVALKLVNLKTGRLLDTVGAYNDQIVCGADVISRIIYSQKKGRLQELKDRVLGTVNGLLGALLPLHGVSPTEVIGAVFAGNTTMTHLMLGVDPQSIREAPYVPPMKSVPVLSAEKVGVHIHPEAPVLFSPHVGSYVGGDITAGMLVARMRRRPHGVELFIDIGTNGELVISGDDWMIGCACSAGPAFEGVGIKCGMRAASGAIESVEIRNRGSEVELKLIGDGPPRGICGSGLIELVADLFTAGLLGRDGKFTELAPRDRIRVTGKSKSFALVEAGRSATGRDISISEQDIANIMRAKAAIFSAAFLLLKNVGVSWRDIHKFHVAGGFGHSLNIRKAIVLGMFPDIAPDRFEYLGNTSLQGAYLALVSGDQRWKLGEIARSMTYIDLSAEPDYMNEYTAALFLPHTDAKLFPSVTRRA